MTEIKLLVYRCPGLHQCAGGTYNFKQVLNQDELDDALSDGWKPTLPEAMGLKSKDVEPMPTRQELEEKAAELGIEFGPSTRNSTIEKNIAKALLAGE